jgi:hypothetical protein
MPKQPQKYHSPSFPLLVDCPSEFRRMAPSSRSSHPDEWLMSHYSVMSSCGVSPLLAFVLVRTNFFAPPPREFKIQIVCWRDWNHDSLMSTIFLIVRRTAKKMKTRILNNCLLAPHKAGKSTRSGVDVKIYFV